MERKFFLKAAGVSGLRSRLPFNSIRLIAEEIKSQNYPPGSATIIPFKLVSLSNVVIDIYDTLGKRITGIFSQKVDSGKHEVVFNNENVGLAKGNYIYQMTIENESGRYYQCKVLVITD